MFAVLTPLIALASVTTMTEQEASVMMTDFDVIVDVRSESAYRQSHVRGAVLQSRTNLQGCENKRVAFYCSAGSASQASAQAYAQESGASQAYAIGTLDNLAASGVEVESGLPSQDPQCIVGGASSQPSSSVPGFVYPLGIALLALLVLLPGALMMRCLSKPATSPSTTSTSREEVEVAEKKLPA